MHFLDSPKGVQHVYSAPCILCIHVICSLCWDAVISSLAVFPLYLEPDCIYAWSAKRPTLGWLWKVRGTSCVPVFRLVEMKCGYNGCVCQWNWGQCCGCSLSLLLGVVNSSLYLGMPTESTRCLKCLLAFHCLLCPLNCVCIFIFPETRSRHKVERLAQKPFSVSEQIESMRCKVLD